MVIVHAVIEDPGAAAGGGGVNDAVKAVFYVKSREAAALPLGKSIVIVKKNTGPQMERVYLAVSRHIPAVCKGWNDLQGIVGFYQRIVQLVHRPNDALVLGKCRVKGGYSGSFIIVKHLLITICTAAAGIEQNSAGKDRKKYNFTIHNVQISNAGPPKPPEAVTGKTRGNFQRRAICPDLLIPTNIGTSFAKFKIYQSD